LQEPVLSARPDDQSVFNEPHMRADAGLPRVCHHCGYDRGGIASSLCPECGQPPHGIEHSPWDEPALHSGSPPESAFTYARWLAERRAATPISTTWATTILIALSAGPLGLMGALWGAGESRFSALALVLFGPLIEEVSKVMAATYIVEKKPYLFASASQILICCAAGGLAFAIFENLLYLFVYFPRHDPWLWAWRWSVCTALHTGCSLIAGLGLVRSWQRSRALSTPPDLNLAAPLLITAIVIHGIYNAGAMLMSLAGF
jgi:hypothetical protein